MYSTYVAEIELLLLSLVVAITIRHRSELDPESLLTRSLAKMSTFKPDTPHDRLGRQSRFPTLAANSKSEAAACPAARLHQMRVLPHMYLSEHRAPTSVFSPDAPERDETALPVNFIFVNNAGVQQAAARLSHKGHANLTFHAPHRRRQPANVLNMHSLV